MTKLLIVIPFNPDNAALAERLCDWMFTLNNQKKLPHVLLVPTPLVHAELVEKVNIAAQVAFAGVDVVIAGRSKESDDETPEIDLMLAKAAEHVFRAYRWPWVWMEPECVPLHADWYSDLCAAYHAQPKRYMGEYMKTGEIKFLAKCSVYPDNALSEFSKLGREAEPNAPTFPKTAPIEVKLAEQVVPRSSRSRLIQQLKVTDISDFEKVRPDAAVLCGDPTGSLIETLRSQPRKKKKGNQ